MLGKGDRSENLGARKDTRGARPSRGRGTRATGRDLVGGRGSRETEKSQQGQECGDAVERYEADRSAERKVCNVIARNRGPTARHALRRI